MCVGLTGLGGMTAVASRPPSVPLDKGIFLVASPQLQDPNFRQTVVLLCAHSREGTLGVIVNRPTDLLLSEALPKVTTLKGTSYRLFRGGPVQPTAILMLFRTMQPPSEGRPVLEGVYLGGSPETLDQVITGSRPSETFRAYGGYAGWGPGQVEAEIATGSWALVAANSRDVFDKDPAQLWQDLMDQLTAPRVISNPVPPLVSAYLDLSAGR